MKKNIILPVLFFVIFISDSLASFAQTDDMKNILGETETPVKKELTTATFKTTRIINAQSIETVKKRTLDFRVTHRFGPTNSGPHGLYGFDASSDIRIGFEYGITDELTVGFARSKRHENLEGLIKYRLLRQTKDNSIPFAVTVFMASTVTPEKDPDSIYSNFLHRINYTTQLVIARKFSSWLSLQLMPTWIHRNFVPYFDDENDLYSLGAGGRIKFSKRSAIIFDYYQTFSKFRTHTSDYGYVTEKFYAPLGLGWEIETGGHVFSIMFTNSAGIIESEYIPYTSDSWLKGGLRFSFNISRNFAL